MKLKDFTPKSSLQQNENSIKKSGITSCDPAFEFLLPQRDSPAELDFDITQVGCFTGNFVFYPDKVDAGSQRR